ncbi:hypothetical protein LTR85_003816 [Meristemomyces frigidus]|nr:hypothetical protein LTR85_003816 [Meristemomyces frigidus]
MAAQNTGIQGWGRAIRIANNSAYVQRLRRSFALAYLSDALERSFSAAAALDPELERLLSHYRLIASQRGDALNKTIWLWSSTLDDWKVEEDQSISQGFEDVQARFLSQDFHGLSLCAVVAAPETVWQLYPFFPKAWLTVLLKSEDAGRVVRLLMSRLLRRHWTPNDDDQAVIDNLMERPAIEPELWEATLSSSHRQRRVLIPGMDNKITARSINGPLEATTWQWQWSRDAPIYEGDLGVYVWEPYKQRPVSDFVQVKVLAASVNAPGRRRAVIVVNSTEVLNRVKETFLRRIQQPSPTSDGAVQVMRFVGALYECVQQDATYFLEHAVANIEQVVCSWLSWCPHRKEI